MYRLGRFTSASFLGVQPDISVHAKLLTGGLVPLCTTLASESIFKTFSSPDKTDALLHGHSYTAHPIGCQVAVESLKEMVKMEQSGHWDWAKKDGWIDEAGTQTETTAHSTSTRHGQVWSVWPHDVVVSLSQHTSRVLGVWALGSVLAIHLKDQTHTGYTSSAAIGLRDTLIRGNVSESWNVHCRVLGNVLYLMAGQSTPKDSLDRICKLLRVSILQDSAK